MCYGTSHLRTAHPIRGQQLVSRIIIVKVRKRKDHGITPWKRCSHKKGGSVKGAGPLFCHCFLSPEQGCWTSQSRRRASSGRKRDSSSFTAAWSVSGESSLASWLLRASMSIQMCPSKMIRLRHAAARTAGGVGVSGRCPDAARWSFIAFRPASTAKRIRRTAPSCSSPESGDNKKASSKRLNVWRKCCREAEDGVKRDGITFPLDKPVKRLKPLFRAVHRFFHSVVDYSVFWRR